MVDVLKLPHYFPKTLWHSDFDEINSIKGKVLLTYLISKEFTIANRMINSVNNLNILKRTCKLLSYLLGYFIFYF